MMTNMEILNRNAIDRVFQLYQQNDWDFKYCVSMVAKNSNIEYSYLLSLCGRESARRRKKKKKTIEEASQQLRLPI